MKNTKLLLASESPYRKKLMEQIGLEFSCEKPLIDEDELKKSISVALEDLPLELAKAKAASLTNEYPNHTIVGSDQMAIFSNQRLDKPKNKDQAYAQLEKLQGKSHQLVTALAVWHEGEWYTNTTVAFMNMRKLNRAEIENYIERDQPVGCAGGYKIESQGPVLFDSIETKDFYSIIGIPLLSLSQILRSLGISTL